MAIQVSQTLAEIAWRQEHAMDAASEHVLFAPEALYGTYVPATKALPVTTFNVTSRRSLIEPELTSFGRQQGVVVQGEKPVNGSLVLPFFPQYMGTLFKAAMTAAVSTQQGGTIAYRHKLLPDDTAPLGSLSFEKQYSASEAQFVKGAKIKKITISCKAKEIAVVTLEFDAQDDAWVGGTWDDDGTAAPTESVVLPYPTTLQLPFRFYQGVVKKGGTLSVVSGEIVVAAGTELASVEAAEITIECGQDPFYGLLGKPTAGAIRDLGRKVTCKLDLDWIAAGDDFIDDGRTAAETVVQLYFTGPNIAGIYNYEGIITLARCVPPQPEPPAIAGSKARRSHSVEYRCKRELTIDQDVGIVIQNAETSI